MTILEPSSDSAPADVADAPATPAAPRPRPRGGKPLHLAERYALLLLLIVIVIFFSVYPDSAGTFPTTANVSVLLGNQAVIALLALAVIFPLVSGYFDFSLGAIAATSGVLSAGLMSRHGVSLTVAVVVSVLLGVLIGLVNGLLVTRLRMNSFVTTLGVATLLGGIIQWYTGGQTITNGVSTALIDFGSQQTLGLPRVVYVVIIAAAIAWFLLSHTPYGRSLYAIGSNPRSARLVGLGVERSVIIAFVIAGALSGVVGVLQLARAGSATADAGTNLLFPALAAAFLGATAVRPGFFNVMGTMIGVLFVAVSVSGLTLSGASAWASPVFNGAALLVAVGLSTYLGRRRGSTTS